MTLKVVAKFIDINDIALYVDWNDKIEAFVCELKEVNVDLRDVRIRLLHSGELLDPKLSWQLYRSKLIITHTPDNRLKQSRHEPYVAFITEPAYPKLHASDNTIDQDDVDWNSFTMDEDKILPLPSVAVSSTTTEEKTNIPTMINTVFVHCAVDKRLSTTIQISQSSSDNTTSDTSISVDDVHTTTRRQQGFERLQEAAGLNTDDIVLFRRQFHALRGTSVQATAEERMQMEEEWLDGGGGQIATDQDTARVELTENAAFQELFTGIAIGFFCGVLILLWLPENGIFHSRQQLAVICGLLVNMSFGILFIIS